MQQHKFEYLINRKKLFIGGFSASTTEEQIKSHFSRFAEIEKCSIILDKHTGRSRCFGFIIVSKKSSISRILSTKHVIDNKKIDCKPAFPKEKIVKFSGSRKVFVGGLMPEITNSEFTTYFSQYGNIEDSIVMKDRGSGKARGFGFVTYEKEQSVEDVMKNYHNHFLRGKWIECKRAVAKEKMSETLQATRLAESAENSPGQRKLSINNEEYTEELCKSLIEFILDEE